jgi:IS30 family transposase
MKRAKKLWTLKERCQMWAAWRRGESLRQIGEGLHRASATIHWQIREKGGIAPSVRSRAPRQLTESQREDISRGLVEGVSFRELGRRLQKPASTISREVARNGGREAYRATKAEAATWSRARRSKKCLLSGNAPLREAVASKLMEDWSPQQIAGWLRDTYENEPAMQVSHETIYRTLFIQARGALRKELTEYLRSQKQIRRTLQLAPNNRGQIPEAVSIRERPAEIEDRAVPGHWEGDLIVGAANSYVATLVERHSRFVMLARVTGKDSATVVQALIERMSTLPVQLAGSLTWDRGTELAQHKRFTVATNIPVYFCDPRSPWQRGSNENTNGLLRQYLKRDEDLSVHSQEQLDAIAKRLNTRPRKTLGYKTPAYKLNAAVALTS